MPFLCARLEQLVEGGVTILCGVGSTNDAVAEVAQWLSGTTEETTSISVGDELKLQVFGQFLCASFETESEGLSWSKVSIYLRQKGIQQVNAIVFLANLKNARQQKRKHFNESLESFLTWFGPDAESWSKKIMVVAHKVTGKNLNCPAQNCGSKQKVINNMMTTLTSPFANSNT